MRHFDFSEQPFSVIVFYDGGDGTFHCSCIHSVDSSDLLRVAASKAYTLVTTNVLRANKLEPMAAAIGKKKAKTRRTRKAKK